MPGLFGDLSGGAYRLMRKKTRRKNTAELPTSFFTSLAKVAENITDPATLDKLATHHSADVRCAVARNPNTTGTTLLILAVDEDERVREAAEENDACPAGLILH